MKSSQFEDRVMSVENKWSLYLLVLSATNETLTFVWCYDAEVTLHVERSDHEYFYKKIYYDFIAQNCGGCWKYWAGPVHLIILAIGDKIKINDVECSEEILFNKLLMSQDTNHIDSHCFLD